MPEKPTQEEVERSFRTALEDVVSIIRKLSPYCNKFDEMIEMVEHGMINDGQLRLLMHIISEKK
jgi:hypothetical protein